MPINEISKQTTIFSECCDFLILPFPSYVSTKLRCVALARILQPPAATNRPTSIHMKKERNGIV